MKSDLTCPVEIVRVTIQRETEDTNENGQILCLIDFFNLSDKVIDSIQMNIICFDAEDQRLGGRLVRAGAHGEPRLRPNTLKTWRAWRPPWRRSGIRTA